MKLSKGFLFALLFLLCAGSVVAYGYWLDNEAGEASENEDSSDGEDSRYEDFLKSEFKRLKEADSKDLTVTETELVNNMGDDWESLETAAVELIIKRSAAANKLAAESVGKYDWQQEPKGTNGWEHLVKADEEIPNEIIFRVNDDFWDGSKPATDAERKELLDSWERAEPHLKLAEQADFLRSPEGKYGFSLMGFYSVLRIALICDFLELEHNSTQHFKRFRQVQALQEKDLSPVTAMRSLSNRLLMEVLSWAVRGAVKKGLILHSELPEIEGIFTNARGIVETLDGEFWTASRIQLETKDYKNGLRLYFSVFGGAPDDIGKWVDEQTAGGRDNQVAAKIWLKKNPGELTDAKFAKKFAAQEFADKAVISNFSDIIEFIVVADVAKASIHLYFDKDGQPPETLPEIPMTICKIEGKEIVFYWDKTHPLVDKHKREYPKIMRIK